MCIEHEQYYAIEEAHARQLDSGQRLRLAMEEIRRDPTNPELEENLAFAFFQAGKYSQSIELYEKLISSGTRSLSTLSGLMNSILERSRKTGTLKENSDQIIQLYRERLDLLPPSRRDGRRWDTDILIECGRFKDAVEVFELESNISENVPEYPIALCEIGRYADAIPFFEEAKKKAAPTWRENISPLLRMFAQNRTRRRCAAICDGTTVLG